MTSLFVQPPLRVLQFPASRLQRRARVLVERWMHDESVVRIGRGARVSA